jgi:hypothetical protein
MDVIMSLSDVPPNPQNLFHLLQGISWDFNVENFFTFMESESSS